MTATRAATRSQTKASKKAIFLKINSTRSKKRGGAVTRSQTRAGQFKIIPALPNSPLRESRKRKTRSRIISKTPLSPSFSIPLPSPSAFTSAQTPEENPAVSDNSSSTYDSIISKVASAHADYEPDRTGFFPPIETIFPNRPDVTTASSTPELNFINFQSSNVSLPTAGQPQTPVEVSGLDSFELLSCNDTQLSNLDAINNENGEAGTSDVKLMPSQIVEDNLNYGYYEPPVIPDSFLAQTTMPTEQEEDTLDYEAMDLSVDFVTSFLR